MVYIYTETGPGSYTKAHSSKRTQDRSRKSLNNLKPVSRGSEGNFRHGRKTHMLRNRFLHIDVFTAYFAEIIFKKIDS